MSAPPHASLTDSFVAGSLSVELVSCIPGAPRSPLGYLSCQSSRFNRSTPSSLMIVSRRIAGLHPALVNATTILAYVSRASRRSQRPVDLHTADNLPITPTESPTTPRVSLPTALDASLRRLLPQTPARPSSFIRFTTALRLREHLDELIRNTKGAAA